MPRQLQDILYGKQYNENQLQRNDGR